MLDLNLDIISKDSSNDHESNTNNNNTATNKKLKNIHGQASRIINMEDSSSSASSTSSIINTAEPDNSSTTTTTTTTTTTNNKNDKKNSLYTFDILKKESGGDNNNTNSPPNYNSLATSQQLFHANNGLGLDLKASSSEMLMGFGKPHHRQEWLNLSLMERISTNSGDNSFELKILEQKHQQAVQVTKKKTRRGPRSRSSQYRGVTFYRRTGRWESHIWDCGKQIYLGGFDTAHAAARAYDQAAIKFRGVDADINFSLSDYEEETKQMKNLSKEEFVQILRRRSTGYGRANSRFRSVTLPKYGNLEEAKMEQLHGNKAYGKAAIQWNGRETTTNFDLGDYGREPVFSIKKAGAGGHNLELSLGISQPSNKTSGNERVAADCHFQCELPIKQTESDASKHVVVPQTLHGVPLPSKNLPPLPALFPSFLSNHEETSLGAGKRIQVLSSSPTSTRFRTLAWQANGNKSINNNTMSQFSVAAASSGFSSPPNNSPFFSYI